MIVLETERLVLRTETPADLGFFTAVLTDAETMRHYPRPYTEEEAAAFLERNIARYASEGFGLWAMVRKDDGALIGQCGITLQDIDGARVPEIGYHVAKAHWGRGYAPEAAAACRDHGFGVLGLPELFIHTSVGNRPSIRVAEKIGMRRIKEYDKTVAAGGRTMRHVVFALANPGRRAPRD